jgi:hypothetical protein
LADSELVGQAGGAVDEADAAAAGDDAPTAFGDAVDAFDAADEGGAAFDAADEAAAVVELAGGAADDDAPAVHPATPNPTTTAAATARRPVVLVEPNIANLFPRPRRRS